MRELASLQNQDKTFNLQDKFREQIFHEDMVKVFELVTKTIKDTSEDLTKN